MANCSQMGTDGQRRRETKALKWLLLVIIILGGITGVATQDSPLLFWVYLPSVMRHGEPCPPTPTPWPTLVSFPSGDFEDGPNGSWGDLSLVNTYMEVFGISHLERYGFWLGVLESEEALVSPEIIMPPASFLCLEYMIYSEYDVSDNEVQLLFNDSEQQQESVPGCLCRPSCLVGGRVCPSVGRDRQRHWQLLRGQHQVFGRGPRTASHPLRRQLYR